MVIILRKSIKYLTWFIYKTILNKGAIEEGLSVDCSLLSVSSLWSVVSLSLNISTSPDSFSIIFFKGPKQNLHHPLASFLIGWKYKVWNHKKKLNHKNVLKFYKKIYPELLT